MHNVSMTHNAANTSSSTADVDADMSLYSLVYGLGAVAIVVAICLRGIIFMTVRTSYVYVSSRIY